MVKITDIWSVMSKLIWCYWFEVIFSCVILLKIMYVLANLSMLASSEVNSTIENGVAGEEFRIDLRNVSFIYKSCTLSIINTVFFLLQKLTLCFLGNLVHWKEAHSMVNPLYPDFPFLSVFKGYRNGKLGQNGLRSVSTEFSRFHCEKRDRGLNIIFHLLFVLTVKRILEKIISLCSVMLQIFYFLFLFLFFLLFLCLFIWQVEAAVHYDLLIFINAHSMLNFR